MRHIFNYLFLFIIIFSSSISARDYLIIQSTTSTVSTGLLEYLGIKYNFDTFVVSSDFSTVKNESYGVICTLRNVIE